MTGLIWKSGESGAEAHLIAGTEMAVEFLFGAITENRHC